MLSALVAQADEIVVKGQRVDGRVVGVGASGIDVETVYGAGKISIPWADLDTVKTDSGFVVLHGDDGVARGELLGVEGDYVIFGSEKVLAADIFRGLDEASYEDSTWQRLKMQYRHWRGHLNVNGALTMATTDSTSFGVSAEAERRKGRTRLLLTFDYLTAAQKDGGGQNRLDNEIRGLARGEFDLNDRIFSFGSFAGNYDQIERLNFRGVTKVGFGYRVWKGDKGEFNVDTGGSYIYEDFFHNPPILNPAPPPAFLPDTRDSKRDYFALAFGADGRLDLPYGSRLSGRVEYLPAVTAWTDNYLLRGTVNLAVPLLEWMSLNFSLFDEYNNAPAEGTFKNKLTVTGGLGVTF